MSGKKNDKTKQTPSSNSVKKSKKAKNKNPTSKKAKMPFSEAGIIKSGRMKFSTAGDGSSLSISGSDMFYELQTTKNFIVRPFPINTRNFALFPKLQTMGLMFEQYCVRKFRVRYTPACPTTRAGSLALMLDYDAADGPPISIIQAMNNASAASGPIGSPLSLNYTPSSQSLRWYYTAQNSDSVTPSAKRLDDPGNLYVITQNSTTADDFAIAGYLSVDYDILFRNMRPTPVGFIVDRSPLIGTVLPASVGGAATPLSQVVENVLGFWNDEKEGTEYPIPGNTAVNATQTVLTALGTYAVGYLASYAGAVPLLTDYINVSPMKSFKKIPTGLTRQITQSEPIPKPLLKRQTGVDSEDLKLFEEPKVRDFPSISYTRIWQDPVSFIFWGLVPGTNDDWEILPTFAADSKELVLVGRDSPMTTGDLISQIVAFDRATGAGTILSSIVNASTSPLLVTFANTLSLAKAAFIVYRYFMPDTRVLSDFQFALTSIDADEAL